MTTETQLSGEEEEIMPSPPSGASRFELCHLSQHQLAWEEERSSKFFSSSLPADEMIYHCLS